MINHQNFSKINYKITFINFHKNMRYNFIFKILFLKHLCIEKKIKLVLGLVCHTEKTT